MKDSALTVTKALPNAAANNNTDVIDLNVDPSTGAASQNQWRVGHVEVTFPALSDHTNASVTNLITLQTSAESGANFANTAPLIQCQVVGVVSTGSVATTFYVPLPPKTALKRYIRFNQLIPTNGGSGTNATVTYNVVA